MHSILERLYIGSYDDARSASQVITARLNVAEERDLTPLWHQTLDHKIPIRDMTPIPDHQLKEAVHWIRDHIGSHTVLVSCNAGVGRSASVIVAYLCSTGYGFGEAVEFVARRKPNISTLPNLILGIDALGNT